MATLTGQSIASSYEQLLHVDTDGGGNTTTLVPIKDGDNGTTFCLQLSTTKAMIEGNGSTLYFYDEGGESISADNAGVLSIAAGAEIDLTATAVDLNGTLDVSGTLTLAGNADFNGDLDVDGTANLDVVDIDGAVDMASTLAVGGDINSGANYIVNEQGRQDHVANTMPAPYYRFDGTNDVITVADSDHLTFGDGTIDTPFSLVVWAKPEDVTSFSMIAKYASSNYEYYFTTEGTDKLLFLLYDTSASANISMLSDSVISSDGEACCYVGTYSGSGANSGLKLYKNGTLVSSTGGGSGSYVAMENLDATFDFGKNLAVFGEGEISKTHVYNKELTATEVKELYSGASVPFKYKGANQTSDVTGDDSDFDTIGNWTNYAGGTDTIVGDFDGGAGTGFLEWEVDGAGSSPSYAMRLDGFLTKGKKYRVTATIQQNTGTGDICFGNQRDTEEAAAHKVTFNTTGATVTYSGEFLSRSTDFFISSVSTGNQVWVIDNLLVVPVGAVAEYDGSGVASDKWFDKSGNDLHGTVSGATLENNSYSLMFGDGTTGFSGDSSKVQLKVGGTKYWNFMTGYMSCDATGALYMPTAAGTAANPVYTFNDDNDTGMYRIGVNQLGFSTDGTLRLTIAADGTFTGSATNDISDVRLKENIAIIPNALESVKKLKGRTFTWKEEAQMQEGTKYGLIAQELEDVLPDLVLDYTGIRYEVEPVEAVEAQDAVESQDAVYETVVVQEAVEAVEEELWAEGDDLPEDVEIGDVKVEAVEAQEEETEEQLVSEAIEAKDAVDAVDAVDGVFYKSIAMSGIIPVLVEAVKELSAKVEALENA